MCVIIDPMNKEYIINKRGVSIVAKCLFHRNEEILISAITTLIFLITPASKSGIYKMIIYINFVCTELVLDMIEH